MMRSSEERDRTAASRTMMRDLISFDCVNSAVLSETNALHWGLVYSTMGKGLGKSERKGMRVS